MSDLEKTVEDKEIIADARDYESEAIAQGWAPKEAFHGAEEDFVDAKTFVKRGEQILPVLKKNNEKLLARLAKAEAAAEEARTAAKEFRDYQKDQYERKVEQYEIQLADLKKAKREALSQGDGDRAVDLDDAIDTVKEAQQDAKAEIEKAKKAPVQTPQVDPALTSWFEKNSWFGQDKKRTALANGVGEGVRAEWPHLTGQAFLDKLDEELEILTPKKQQNHNPVEGRSEIRPSGGGKKQSYDNLPDDAKAACNKFVKQGLLTREQYVAEFDWS